MWKWTILRVQGRIALQKEGLSENRAKAMHAASESLNGLDLKWSEIQIWQTPAKAPSHEQGRKAKDRTE